MCVYVEPRRRVIMRWPGPGEIISQEAARWRKGASEWAPWLPAIKKSSRARKQFPLPAPATAAPTAAAKTLNLYYYVLAVSALCPNAFRSPPAASLFCVSRDFAHGGAVRSLAVKISRLRLTLRGFNNGKSRSSKALSQSSILVGVKIEATGFKCLARPFVILTTAFMTNLQFFSDM